MAKTLTPEQIAQLDIASARVAAGKPLAATANNAGDVANIDYAKKQGYVYTPKPAAPAPTADTATPKPTIADVAKNVTIDEFADTADMQALGDKYKTQANEVVDEEAIRKAARDRMQAQIDSINQYYNQRVSEAKVAGTGRLGTARAIQARSGTLGSDFGAAQTTEVENYNQDIVNSIDAERNAKIGAILTEAENDASSEITAKRAAIEKGATAYLDFLKGQNERKQAKLGGIAQMLLDKGIDPSQLTQEQLDKISKSYGSDVGTLTGLYNTAKTAKQKLADEQKQRELEQAKTIEETNKIKEQTKAEIEKAKKAAEDKTEFFNLSEGQSRYIYDPKTGTAKVVAAKGKTYKNGGGSGTGGSGKGGSVAITADGSLVSYDDPEYTLKTIRASKGGKDMTGEQSKPISKAMQAITQMTDLQNALGPDWESQVGPVVGIINSANPWNVKAQEIKGRLAALLPNMARGVYGEVGVLTDQDIENYSKTLLNLKSPAEVNKVLLAASNKAALNSLETSLQTMAASNRDVSRFEPIFVGVKKRVEGNINSLKSKAEAQAGTQNQGGATVKVKNPTTGQIGTIPAANLDKALKKGYIQVK